MYRAVVVVSWSTGPGQTCSGSACRFVLTSLLDPSTDTVFMRNGGSVGGAPAVAVPDLLVVKRGTTGWVNVKSNDLGTLGSNPVSIAGNGGATRGTVSLSTVTTGVVNYTAGTVVGVDTVTYTLTDTPGRTSTGLLTVTVTL